MSANPLAFAGHSNGHTSQPKIAIIGAGGNDRVTHGMADQLPAGSIETGRKLEVIVGIDSA